MTYSKHIISEIVEDINNHSQENLYLYDLKNIDYDTSLIVQEEIHAYVKNENIPGVILSLEYPNIFTIGKSGKKSDILLSQQELNSKGIKVYESNRGGEITYHGPGQIIYYPIINLKKLRIKPVEYIRILQRTVIASLKDFNIQDQLVLNITECEIGSGLLDHGTYLTMFEKYCSNSYMMIEHVQKHRIPESLSSLIGFGDLVNINLRRI